MDLKNISPLDGRYYTKTIKLREIFSEYALIKYRIYFEIEYLLFLFPLISQENEKISQIHEEKLEDIYKCFTEEEALRVKEIEKITNHDVKAVEYYIKEKLDKLELSQYKSYIHFGLTSQDINSLCYVIQIRNYITNLFIPSVQKMIELLSHISQKYIKTPMLSFTHGQSATPTTLGKEIMVFSEKIQFHIQELERFKYKSKFGGAVGNLNAHYVSYPNIDWINQCNIFLQTFDIARHKYTTQIDNYDQYSIIFDHVKRIQTIFIDLCQDMWIYISKEYFILKKTAGEIGSSTMPHKVNPIDFENAEGNFYLSNQILEFLSKKLPVSRMQRDLTDSTLLRNLGVAFGYGFIAIQSLSKGLKKIEVNKKKLYTDLNHNWIIIMEGIQTILRREGISNAYELTKEFIENNENNEITKEKIHYFIDLLDISINIKKELKQITPFNYIGKI
jgi:adenylosuccinate lyase